MTTGRLHRYSRTACTCNHRTWQTNLIKKESRPMQPISRSPGRPFTLNRTPYRWLGIMVALIMLAACQPVMLPADEGSAATVPEVTIEVNDTEFTIPADFPGGIVAVTMKNNSSQDLDIGFTRVREGSSADELIAMSDNFMENLVPISQMASFIYSFNPLPAGESGRVIMDLKTGDFIVDATAHTEGEPVPGAAHLFDTFRATTVVGTVEPQADVKVELNDFAFVMPDEIAAGEHLWEFTNVGHQWHMIFFVQPVADASLQDVLTALMTEGEPAGPPPFEFLPLAGIPPIGEGERVWVETSMEAGTYIGACPLPDIAAIIAGGEPMSHLAEGMHRVLTVTGDTASIR